MAPANQPQKEIAADVTLVCRGTLSECHTVRMNQHCPPLEIFIGTTSSITAYLVMTSMYNTNPSNISLLSATDIATMLTNVLC